MKKTIILLIIVFVLGIGCIFYISSINNVALVKLNEEITLKRNEKVKLENEEVYLTIKKFIDSPPPEGATSIWSGLAVIYKLEIDGKSYKTNDIGILEDYESIPYIVDVLDSDYKTFAKVKIVENEDFEKIQELVSFDIEAISYLNLMPEASESEESNKAYFSFSLNGIDKETFLNNCEIESIRLNDVFIDNKEILFEDDNGFRFYSENYKMKNNKINLVIRNKKTGEKYSKTLKVSTKAVF